MAISGRGSSHCPEILFSLLRHGLESSAPRAQHNFPRISTRVERLRKTTTVCLQLGAKYWLYYVSCRQPMGFAPTRTTDQSTTSELRPTAGIRKQRCVVALVQNRSRQRRRVTEAGVPLVEVWENFPTQDDPRDATAPRSRDRFLLTRSIVEARGGRFLESGFELRRSTQRGKTPAAEKRIRRSSLAHRSLTIKTTGEKAFLKIHYSLQAPLQMSRPVFSHGF